MSFEILFECLIFGVKCLELLKTWNLLEPLEVLSLLVESTLEQITSLLIWWQVLPHKSLSSLDKDIMDLLASKQDSSMDGPDNTWFQRESPPPCRCCGLVGTHYDCFISPSETTPDLEPTKLITATVEMDLPDFLALDAALCQPVGTLPAKPVCFMGAVKQRETVIEPGH